MFYFVGSSVALNVVIHTTGTTYGTPAPAPYPGVYCSVLETGTDVLATIYATSSSIPLNNPFFVAADGSFQFYGAANNYDLIFSLTVPAGASVQSVVVPSIAQALLPSSSMGGSLARVTNKRRGLWMYQGTQWFDLNAATINIQEFGAVGDGITDDTIAIRAALAQSYQVVNGSGRCAIVECPPGEYLTGTLTFSGALNTGSVWFRGAGMENTKFLLKAATNAPLLEVGGADTNDGTNFGGFSDFSVSGNAANQTLALPVIRSRRYDRGHFSNIFIADGKGVGMLVEGCSVTIEGVQADACASHGMVIDACISTTVDDCFFNDNGGYGLVAQFTNADLSGSPPPVQLASGTQQEIRSCHFERNLTGEVLIDGVEHTWLHHNMIQPVAGGVSSWAVLVTGVAARNNISENMFAIGGAQQISSAAGNPNDFYAIRFNGQTFDNVHAENQYNHLSQPSGITTQANDQVLDLGANYAMERDQFQVKQFGGLSGGHALGGWETQGRTNYCLYSEDLTNGAWVTANIDSITQNATNPISKAVTGSFSVHSSVNTVSTPNGAVCTVTQTVTGLSIAAGDLWSFSAWMCLNSWTLGEATDVRIRILDASNNVLADRDFWLKQDWQRYACSFVATTTYSSLKVQFFKYRRGSSNTFFVWGAMLAPGNMAPYVATTSAAVVSPRGYNVLRLTTSKALQVGIGGAVLTSTIYYNATFNPGTVSTGTFGHVQQTVTGVALGDLVVGQGYSATQQIAGTFFSAIVTATDTMEFQFFNFSGGNVTPTGTGFVIVAKSIPPGNA